MQPLWKIVWNFLRKLKIVLPFDPAIPLLGLYPKNPETPIQMNLCTPMFIAAQYTIAKCWKQPQCPSANEWIKKLRYVYTMEFYAAERQKELIPFATAWMELESIMLSEISQVVRDKYHMISPLTKCYLFIEASPDHSKLSFPSHKHHSLLEHYVPFFHDTTLL